MAGHTPRPLSSTGGLCCTPWGPLLLLSDILRGHRNGPQPHIQGRFLAPTPCPHLHPYQNTKIRTCYSSCRDSTRLGQRACLCLAVWGLLFAQSCGIDPCSDPGPFPLPAAARWARVRRWHPDVVSSPKMSFCRNLTVQTNTRPASSADTQGWGCSVSWRPTAAVIAVLGKSEEQAAPHSVRPCSKAVSGWYGAWPALCCPRLLDNSCSGAVLNLKCIWKNDSLSQNQIQKPQCLISGSLCPKLQQS